MTKTLTSTALTPKTDLAPDILEKFTVNGFGETNIPLLKKLGWTDSTAGGVIGLALGPDNARVLSANFFLLGRVHDSPEGVTTQPATKFWPKARPTIEVRLPLDDLRSFRFDGCLQSAIVDGSTINHEFFDTASKSPLTLDQFTEAGGGPFSLKAYCHMKSKLWFALTVALLPKSKEDLLTTFPYANNNLFPGINFLSLDIKMMPNAPADYSLAFAPLLQKGNKDAVYPPNKSFELRSSIAALLKTGKTPKLARDGTSLLNKWSRLLALGDKAEDSLSPPTNAALRWPDALPSPTLPAPGEDQEGMFFF